MTEYYKEKFYNEYAIKKGDTTIAIVDSGTNAIKICDELNGLTEENQKLKERRHEDINELSVIAMKYKALEDTGNALSRHIDILKIRLQDKDELLRKELQINENYLDKINTLEEDKRELSILIETLLY